MAKASTTSKTKRTGTGRKSRSCCSLFTLPQARASGAGARTVSGCRRTAGVGFVVRRPRLVDLLARLANAAAEHPPDLGDRPRSAPDDDDHEDDDEDDDDVVAHATGDGTPHDRAIVDRWRCRTRSSSTDRGRSPMTSGRRTR